MLKAGSLTKAEYDKHLKTSMAGLMGPQQTGQFLELGARMSVEALKVGGDTLDAKMLAEQQEQTGLLATIAAREGLM